MKKIIVFLVLLISSFSSCGKEVDREYLEVRNDSKDDYLRLAQYYDRKREKELERIFLELDELYKNNKDKEVLKYIEENVDNYSYNIWNYYAGKIIEECDNDCSKRLIELYSYLYERTGNIEILASILEYKEVIGEPEYNRIKEIGIRNNSVKAMREDIKQKIRESKKENASNSIRIGSKDYRIIQEQKLNPESRYEKAMLCTDEEDIYLALSKGKKKIVKKIEIHSSAAPWLYLQSIDLNNDGKEELIVQYGNDIYIFKIEEGIISKVFDGYEDIPLNKYFRYEVNETEIRTVLTDDFKNNIVQQTYKLPHEKEIYYLSKVLEDPLGRRMHYGFVVMKEKVVMDVISMADYIYEIIFDKDYRYKVKVVKKKELKN